MRFETAGALRRVDLEPVVALLPPLRDEWAGLRFGADGLVVDPLTGGSRDALVLVEGRHRLPGAVYRVAVSPPAVPDAVAVSQASDPLAGRTEVEPKPVTVTLRRDDSRTLAFLVQDEARHWSVEVEIEHGRLPTIRVEAEVDMTAAFEAEGTPGCLARLVGGPGGGTIEIDLGSLDRGGTIVSARGRLNRFRVRVDLDVRTTSGRWSFGGRGSLRGRGLGRFLLWVLRGRIRKSVACSLEDFWASADAHADEIETEVERVRIAVDEEGGPAAFVRRALWDEDFDPGFEALGSGPT